MNTWMGFPGLVCNVVIDSIILFADKSRDYPFQFAENPDLSGFVGHGQG